MNDQDTELRSRCGACRDLGGTHSEVGDCRFRTQDGACLCGHGLHLHETETDPELCMVCGSDERCAPRVSDNPVGMTYKESLDRYVEHVKSLGYKGEQVTLLAIGWTAGFDGFTTAAASSR